MENIVEDIEEFDIQTSVLKKRNASTEQQQHEMNLRVFSRLAKMTAEPFLNSR